MGIICLKGVRVVKSVHYGVMRSDLQPTRDIHMPLYFRLKSEGEIAITAVTQTITMARTLF